jgi:hypothetical protein
LDFHTSGDIEGVGVDFDPEEFAATLERARVDSITCFARCHHGYMYFDTKAFPERRHPHLKRNLLREQIEACHARGIRVPIYTTVQWDRLMVDQHPEWLVMAPDGSLPGNDPYGPGFYAPLCVNTPYLEFLKAHVTEMFEMLPVDGIFFDIVQQQDCSCRYCRAGMEEEGLDPSGPEVRRHYAIRVLNHFKRDMTGFVHQFSRDCTIFYNAGHIGPQHREVADAYSHFEIESLPSGGWGYMHFPLSMRYARTLGIDCLGMTGKFHIAWGDFHSLKNPAALEFECFRILALGGKCSIGDQLHPGGKIDQATYQLIGPVYSEVEAKEPWCRGARPLADVAVFSPEEFTGDRTPPLGMGAVRMLQEGGHQFDLVDSSSDLSGYKVVVLPDVVTLSPTLAGKLDRYLAGGGALIASYQSGLNQSKDAFALKALGVTLKGEAPFSPDFIRPSQKIGRGLPATELVMYLRGMEVQANAGSEVLAEVIVPYFNRGRQFCSHRHTPSSGKVGYPGIVRNGKAIYFSHPIFTQYDSSAPRWCKQLLLNALDLLLPNPLVRVEAPTTTLTALNEQAAQNRWVLHLLHYIPERRGNELDTIEDVIPLFDIKVSLLTPRPVKDVTCVPSQEQLPFARKGDRTEFVVPKLMGHQMVALGLE